MKTPNKKRARIKTTAILPTIKTPASSSGRKGTYIDADKTQVVAPGKEKQKPGKGKYKEEKNFPPAPEKNETVNYDIQQLINP
jgi:hypothetical protein